MNPRSDIDFSSPKVDLQVNLQDIAIELSRPQESERTLDIFNITLARQQAEMEASKAGLKIYRPGVKMDEEESGGWFGWMWNWSGEKKEDKEIKASGFEELMTPEEKAKLYKAIGYSETAIDPTLPKEARKFSSKISTFEVIGLEQNKTSPMLLSQKTKTKDQELLSVLFETNPLDESADQRLRVESQPLEIVYDALILSQEDLTVVLRTLNENLQDSEDKSVTPPTVDISKDVSTNDPLMNQKPGGTTVITAAVVEAQKPARLKSTLKLNFQFDSLTLVLYSSAGTQITTLEPRDEHLKLAQFTLGLISTSVTMLSDSSMKASVKLSNCLLDDKRQKVQKASCRMVEMKSGSEKNVMVDINYRQSAEGTVLDTVVRDIYLCASMEFLLTVADVFVQASQHSYKATQNTTKQVVVATKEQVISSQPVAKMEINVQVKNPEIVFVADLSRGDAPSLVVTTQCEVNIKNDCNIQQMTAAIKDLKVVACPFLTEMRRNNITTVSPIIINTVLTIISALYPTAETPAELTSPVPPNLWDTKDAKDLNLWFLEEQTNTEDKPVTPLIPTGESLKMNIESIIVTLEAGIGHRTVPMLLAKSSFSGDVKNWSTLINLQSSINLEVHYFNEILGVWEPLLEPLEKESTDDFRPWALNIKMKKKPLKHNEEQDETDFSIPDYKTVVTISSKDQLNMTLSNCGLVMLSNLGKAFADAASQTAENFQKDQAPFVVKNCLGTCVSISHSNTFSVIGVESRKKVYELQDGGTLNMDYLRTMTETEQFTAMTCMSSKTHYIQLTPNDHSSADRISLEKVGRGMYSVLHQASGVLRYIVCHIYTLEGSKVVTIHSPFQENDNHTVTVKEGRSSEIHTAVIDHTKLKLCLLNYLNQDWRGEYNIKSNHPEIDFIQFSALTDDDKTELDIAIHITYNVGQMVIALHSPYWMVNKTGRLLQYKADDVHRKHPLEYESPLLFSFKPKNFFQNNKVQLMISDSELSDGFSLDTVGSYGDVKCKGRQKDFMSVPFWPEKDSKKLMIKILGCEMPSQMIDFCKQENGHLLHLDNKFGGVIVDVNVNEHSSIIRFSDYHDGAAPFLIINQTKSEIIEYYQSSDIVWETKPKPKSRWKPMSIKHSELLEGEFRRYIESGPVSDSIIDLAPDFQVCLTPTGSEMKMFLPNEAPIRRNFLPALKVEYSVSARQKSYRIQLYRIQIQNQLPGAIFPFVFFPVKPPKSVTMDSEPKPLADVSIVTRSAGHSNISRIKYFKVLIQEMDFKMDMGFLYALTEIFTQANQEAMSSGLEVELFEKDVEYLKMPLDSGSSTDTSPVSLYEYFHISPIKLHLSFSLSTGGEDGNREKRDTEFIPVQSLNLLLKSIGATLTDVQDVIFKLGFFELTYQFCTTQQLQWEVIRHYSKQAIKQMYVLVLGLDVLGNPFGLIRGLSEGVEAFFYEPYQGAIQGPEEFVEGMALGVKALVGGAVGGIAGAASRITGAMAKGVAAITMDEDYQQKRREEMNRQPSGLREGITRGGKGLVSGFVSGITGIVTKPIKGAQKEGATGFFKGVGKGLVGAVARPAGGIIDMASSTFQGIKRATESSEEVESLRPPRFIHEDGVIRPYREREGFGSQMLQKRMAYAEWIRTDSDDDDIDS
ncbi:VP13A protein, partial [Polypterus senegalus]